MARAVPVHYLRPNDDVWSPAHVAFVDTEADERDVPGGSELRMTLWCAATVDRTRQRQSMSAWRWGSGRDPASLADWIDHRAQLVKELWVFAHNLGFDLSVTQLPERLTRCGWRCTDFHISDESCYFRMAKGGRRLVLTDSFGWLSLPLLQVGALVGVAKPPLPGPDDGDAAWRHRCRRDVEALAKAMLQVLKWWDDNELGRFGVTGASCGWAAFRHRSPIDRIVIDPDPDGRALERRAMYGGWRETFRVGTFDQGQWTDHDFAAAYPTAAAHHRLPQKRLGAFASIPAGHPFDTSPLHGYIAECVVTTATPCVPVRWAGGVWYPVGTFATVLCSPEVALARRMGATVVVGRGYGYRLGWTLQRWAQWIAKLQSAPPPGQPLVVRPMLKSWGRSVIGKFAARTSRTVATSPALWPTWHIEKGWNADAAAPIEHVTLGGVERWVMKDQEADNAFPAVTAWVESLVRVALRETIARRPDGAVWSVNTDGWLEAARGAVASPDGPWCPAPYRSQVKGTYSRVELMGPNHVQLDTARRMAGVPRSFTREAPRTYVGRLWPGLRWQLLYGSPGAYRRPERVIRLEQVRANRWVLRDGSTLPVTFALTRDGANEIAPWALSQLPPGAALADEQHRALAAALAAWQAAAPDGVNAQMPGMADAI